MEDIAKGLKIAGTIGGAALKAAKTVQDTLQTAQGAQPGQASSTPSQGTYQQNQGAPQSSHAQAPVQTPPASVSPTQHAASEQNSETFFCDQCGAPVRPGKRFCNHCGARLP